MHGSNHPAQAASYFDTIVNWEGHAAKQAEIIVERLNLTAPACSRSLHFPDHIGPWGMQSRDTHVYMHWNGDFASLLFLNHYEYTRNTVRARDASNVY